MPFVQTQILDRLTEIFEQYRTQHAFVFEDEGYTYSWLLDAIDKYALQLRHDGLTSGSVVLFEGRFAPWDIAALIALMQYGAIVVPRVVGEAGRQGDIVAISQAQYHVTIDDLHQLHLFDLEQSGEHSLYSKLRKHKHSGLVLFTSGTTGQPKGIVHDVTRFLAKYSGREPRSQRIVAHLIFDHMGGIDTLFYSLFNASTLIIPKSRDPQSVAQAIQEHQAELFPTSPSFLNLLLLSGIFGTFDLSSLQKIAYGSEPMSPTTLSQIHQALPHVKLTQTYGSTEAGVLRSVSKSSDSLLVKLGGSGIETRVIDGILQVRSPNMMLGVLDDPQAITFDGWYNTQDLVEEHDGYLHIFGRANNFINVGGEKVNPVQVENTIRELAFIEDVRVYGERNPIMGQIVCAKVTLTADTDKTSATRQIKQHCLKTLGKHATPTRIKA